MDQTASSHQRKLLRPRIGARAWPPKIHKFPITFSQGNEAVGLLKSVSVDLSKYYNDTLERSRNLRSMKKSHWVCEQLEKFDLSFYLPIHVLSTPSQKLNTIVIMINGLNEITHVNFAHYDRIGAALASKGIGAILHPSPFHLNRAAYMEQRFKKAWENYPSPEPRLQTWPESPGAETTSRLPHHSILRHPEAIFHCFEQLSNEVIALAKFFQTFSPSNRFDHQDVLFYDRFFEKKPRIALIGYSFGGLEALYSFLKEPNLFDHCILFNSGAAITKLRTKPVRISNKDWDDIVQRILFQRTHLPMDIPLDNQELLDEVLLNRPFTRTRVRELLCENVSKLLFISGGADIVSPSEYVLQFIEKESMSKYNHTQKSDGLNVLQIGGLQHHLHNSSFYDQWFPVIINTIESFLRGPHPSGKQVSYEEVVSGLSKLKIKGLDLDLAVMKNKWLDEEDHSIRVEEIYDKLKEDEKKEFIKLYIVSKRYFSTDSELLRTMERERDRVRSAVKKDNEVFEGT